MTPQERDIQTRQAFAIERRERDAILRQQRLARPTAAAIMDATMFARGKHNGSFINHPELWRGKEYDEVIEHAHAEFVQAHQVQGVPYSERQLLSYIAGFLVGFMQAMQDVETEEEEVQ